MLDNYKFSNGQGLEILIAQFDRCGKRPSLFVKVPGKNAITKLASFQSEEKAKLFVDYIVAFLKLNIPTS